MTLTLLDISAARFRTSQAADDANSEFRKRLGLRERYAPARLAIARSLSVAAPPEPVPEGEDFGKEIRGEQLFGSGPDLTAWIALIVERAGREGLTRKDIQSLVAAHWRRGIRLLDQDWAAAEGDLAKFVTRLVDAAGLESRPVSGLTSFAGEESGFGLVAVMVGEIARDFATDEIVSWLVNGQGGSPHAALMGGVGSGKTRTAATILKSFRSQSSAPILAFDFKGDLASSYKLDTAFDATLLSPPRQPIPLDVLALGASDPVEMNQTAERFRESFARLKQSKLGPVQADAIREAALQVLRTKRPARLSDIREAAKREYASRGLKEDGAIATLNELCAYSLFEPLMTPTAFFSQSWIITMPPSVSEPVQRIVINLLLDALDRYLNSLPDAPIDAAGNRALRNICMIDEAHRILETRLPALGNLIRMSRSKGGSIMLISQSPNDFESEDNEFLDNLGLVVAFATNAKPGAARRIFGPNANLATLRVGEAYVKLRGEPMTRRVGIWEPS